MGDLKGFIRGVSPSASHVQTATHAGRAVGDLELVSSFSTPATDATSEAARSFWFESGTLPVSRTTRPSTNTRIHLASTPSAGRSRL